MKKLFKVGGSAVGAAALLVMWSGTAAAATATCPGPSAPAFLAGTVQVTVNTTNGSAECWDYGSSNASPGVDYNTPVRTFWNSTPADSTDMQIPELAGDIDEYKVNAASGTTGFLTVKPATCVGPTCTAKWSLSAISDGPIYLLFKFGGGGTGANAFDPAWFAFRFAGGFVSTLTDTFSWTRGDYDGSGNFVPGGTGSASRLSHTSLYGAPSDEWRPIPIPAAAWLLGSGLLGLFAVGRRRKSGVVTAA